MISWTDRIAERPRIMETRLSPPKTLDMGPAPGVQNDAASAALQMLATAVCLQHMGLQFLADELETLLELPHRQPVEGTAAARIRALVAEVSHADRQARRAEAILSSAPRSQACRTEQLRLRRAASADLRAALSALNQPRAATVCSASADLDDALRTTGEVLTRLSRGAHTDRPTLVQRHLRSASVVTEPLAQI